MPIQPFADYDPFAWVYNARWGGDYHQQILPILDALLLKHVPAGGTLLDLCCGAGHVTQQLAARGYRMIGVDGSAEMLRYARERVPEATFLVADAREFTLPTPVAGVLCTFDSLNHVMSVEGLTQVFRCVHQALAPGGCFCFDLNDEAAYRDCWAQTGTNVEDELVEIARGTYNSATRTAKCEITLFRRQLANWSRSDFCLEQQCHAQQDVLAALRQAGITEIQRYDAAALGMQGRLAYGRSFYCVRRP